MKEFIRTCWMAVILTAILICPSSIEAGESDEIYISEPVVIEPISGMEEPCEEPVMSEKETYEPVITEHKSDESENYIWEELSKHSPSDEITAGIMGYFWRESQMRSDAVAGWDIRNAYLDNDICVTFTEEVDSGLHDGSTKEHFKSMTRIHYGGYGLGQWSADCYLDHLYEFVKKRGGSIGDAALQCEFIFESLKQNEELWADLLTCTNAMQTGRRIALYYDGTSCETAEAIAGLAAKYYKEYT